MRALHATRSCFDVLLQINLDDAILNGRRRGRPSALNALVVATAVLSGAARARARVTRRECARGVRALLHSDSYARRTGARLCGLDGRRTIVVMITIVDSVGCGVDVVSRQHEICPRASSAARGALAAARAAAPRIAANSAAGTHLLGGLLGVRLHSNAASPALRAAKERTRESPQSARRRRPPARPTLAAAMSQQSRAPVIALVSPSSMDHRNGVS